MIAWRQATLQPKFDPSGKTEDELMLMEFNGDIVKLNYQDDGKKGRPIVLVLRAEIFRHRALPGSLSPKNIR